MSGYLMADGLPVCVGDVVTRVNDNMDEMYYVHDLIRGRVVKDVERGQDGETFVMVMFDEAESEWEGMECGCHLKHIVHLEKNLNTFDENQFLAMLGM